MTAGPMALNPRLAEAIRAVRRRYALRVLLRGVSLCGLAFLLVVWASAEGLDAFRYSSAAIWLFRVFAWTALAAALVRFVVLPARAFGARATDVEVARYIEEHEPSLDAALRAAVETEPAAGPARDTSPELKARLVADVARTLERLDVGARVEHRPLRRAASFAFGVAVTGAMAALFSPVFVRQALPYLFSPFSTSARAASPYAIAVTPGSVAIARGSDQEVTATLSGFESSLVEIVTRGAGAEWSRAPMAADPGGRDSRFILTAVNEPVEYFVESNGVRSDVFRLDVQERPYVKTIDLEYRFPAYTRLEPRTVEGSGDIAALVGTDVLLKIAPTFEVKAGRLVVEGRPPVALVVEAPLRLIGRLRVAANAFYRVELQAPDGAFVAASPDYAIEAIDDLPPVVTFAKPGRDTQVTPIEEVFAEARAEDDFGIARLDLVYAVNGGPERTKPLHQAPPLKEVTAGHTFFLEELSLSPGDFVSYYARASDLGAAGAARTATSDIYFFEARPFRRDFRQAEDSGMGGGGGGGGEGGSLSQRQKQVIAATFRLRRDAMAGPGRPGDAKTRAQDVRTVAVIQGRLRNEVDQLRGRMVSRGVLNEGSEMHGAAEEMRQATDAMKEAEADLEALRVQEALGPEQRALAHLQRAEAQFRDVQVARGAGGGGGGGQSGAEADELADLFELELDKLKNQYETLQSGAQQKRDEQIDEAMARLQELARRQEQENERARQRGARAQGGGGGGSASQRQLADEAEELGRQLERLTRDNPQSSPSLEESARRLRDAAAEMRRQAANPKSGSSGGGQTALESLRDARQKLDQDRGRRLDRDLREAKERAEELEQAQERIARDVRDMSRAAAGEPGSGGLGSQQERAARLQERKDALASGVADLESKLDRMARESRREQKDASRRMQEAANGIRDSKLKEKIRYTRGLVDRGTPQVAESFERDIQAQIGALSEKLGEAQGALGVSPEERRRAALDRARELARGLDSMEERLRARGGEGDRGGERAGDDRAGRGSEGGRGSSMNGGVPGGGGIDSPGRLSADEGRQLSRELRERAAQAEEFRRALEQGGIASGEARALAERLAKLSNGRQIRNPLGVAELTAQITADLKMLEYVLRREIEGDRPKLQLSGSEELPPGYKALVEEYYRSLSRRAPPQPQPQPKQERR